MFFRSMDSVEVENFNNIKHNRNSFMMPFNLTINKKRMGICAVQWTTGNEVFVVLKLIYFYITSKSKFRKLVIDANQICHWAANEKRLTYFIYCYVRTLLAIYISCDSTLWMKIINKAIGSDSNNLGMRRKNILNWIL